MPKLFLLIVIHFAITVLPVAASAEELIKVAFWNIENLGDRSRGQHPKAISQHLRLVNPHVLALSEIHSDSGPVGKRRSSELDDIMDELNSEDGSNWKYRLFDKKDEVEIWQEKVLNRIINSSVGT